MRRVLPSGVGALGVKRSGCSAGFGMIGKAVLITRGACIWGGVHAPSCAGCGWCRSCAAFDSGAAFRSWHFGARLSLVWEFGAVELLGSVVRGDPTPRSRGSLIGAHGEEFGHFGHWADLEFGRFWIWGPTLGMLRVSGSRVGELGGIWTALW